MLKQHTVDVPNSIHGDELVKGNTNNAVCLSKLDTRKSRSHSPLYKHHIQPELS
jgi:hypothetical protein